MNTIRLFHKLFAGFFGAGAALIALCTLALGSPGQSRERLIAAVAGGLVLSALMAWFFARRLSEPVDRLTEGTRRLINRDFSTPIATGGAAEIASLASDFNRLAEQLSTYEENQRRWIGDIAHELRTPLSVVSAEVEAILDGVREPTLENLGSIRDEVTQLTRLVEDLHALSIVESGSLRLHLERQDLLVMVLQFADTLAPVLSEQQLSLRIASQAEGARVTVMADRHRFRQVVGNLIGNTLRYANKPGWVEIAVREAGDEVVLTITDSGPGVPPDALSQLFDRLYRVEESRNRARGGSGLGLSIVRSIIEAHGGSISAENIPAAGLRMTVRLPKITSPERV
jgi:two-component system sensor histidine kinase BaeS